MNILLLIKIICLILLTSLAAFFDVKYRKIPNLLSLIIGGFGFVLLYPDYKSMIFKLCILLFLFIFGAFRLMGMGDLKLWMAIAMLCPFPESCFIISSAALLLILFSMYKHRKESVNVLKLSIQDLIFNKRIQTFEQRSYPFAPFIFVTTLISCILKLKGLII